MDETCDIYDGDSGERCGKPAHFLVHPVGCCGQVIKHVRIWLCAEHYDWWRRTERMPDDGETV